jgi:hypothetical protein
MNTPDTYEMETGRSATTLIDDIYANESRLMIVKEDTDKGHGLATLTPFPSAPGDVVELRRQSGIKPFGVVSTLAVGMTLMATWEALCVTMGSGDVSGGPVSLVYGFIGTLLHL